MDRGEGEGGNITIFFQKIFCLTVPKNFVGEPFCAVIQKISGSEKVYGLEGGGGRSIKIFRRKFLSHTTEKLRSGTLVSHKISGTEKI